jgi:hypothetical protein
MIYVIYWLEHWEESGSMVYEPNHTTTDDLIQALKTAEEMRKRQYSKGDISHVTLTSENPNSVGKSGVDTVDPDYNWKKRRL